MSSSLLFSALEHELRVLAERQRCLEARLERVISDIEVIKTRLLALTLTNAILPTRNATDP